MSEENLTSGDDPWRSRILTDRSGIARVIGTMSRVAVVGIKPEHVGGPAFYVPEAMQKAGITIIPVPVYYPEVTEILGESVHRALRTIAPPADTVLLFRRSTDVAKHVDEILAAKPSTVWMQLGIEHAEAAERFARAGMTVVQNKCLMVELARIGR